MKRLAFLAVFALVGCGPQSDFPNASAAGDMPVQDGCVVKTSSKMVNQLAVGEVTNLVKDEVEWGHQNECTVTFDITVNGKTYHLQNTRTGMEQMASVCYEARETARKNLLLDIGGTFKTESVIACRRYDK
jgi:hypothetical protein